MAPKKKRKVGSSGVSGWRLFKKISGSSGLNIEDEYRLHETSKEPDVSLGSTWLSDFPQAWAETGGMGLAVRQAPLIIPLKATSTPVSIKQYPMSQEARLGIKPHIQRLLDQGILVPCQSPWNTPLLPVKKPGTNDYRPVQDLREVNKRVEDIHPTVPNPYNLLSGLPPSHQWYTVLDLKDAFFCLRLHPTSQPLFAFEWRDPEMGISGQLTWTRLPQGFKNSPTLFNEALHRDLADFRIQHPDLILLQYVDDLLLAATSELDCQQGTRALLQTLGNLGYRASAKKAQICQKQVKYLGYLLKEGQRWLTEARKETVMGQPTPKTPRQLREFLGKAGFCRLFIPGFAEMAAPLYPLTKPGTLFNWGPDQQKAYQEIKQALLTAPALGLPDLTKPFELFVDEKQGYAKGVLTQKLGPWRRPVAYLSKKLDPVAAGWPPCLRMVAAIAVLTKDAGKLTMGQPLVILAPHAVEALVKQPPDRWLSNARMTHYQALLLDTDRVQFGPVVALNPATLLPLPEEGLQHNCLDILAEAHGTRPDLTDQPLPDADHTWYTDGSSLLQEGQRKAGAAVTTETEVIWAKALPAGTSAQRAELIALTQALKMAEGKKLNVYTDSRYAFATAHIHGEIYRRRGWLTSEGKEIKNKDEILALLKALFLPKRLSIIHCPGHQKGHSAEARGNRMADQAARKAAITETPDTSTLLISGGSSGGSSGSETPGTSESATPESSGGSSGGSSTMVTKYILGLDIGITSVGYGIINYEDKTIIDAGVRLFPEANVENNEGRRSKRGARRLKRRRIHRLDRIKQLLSEYNLVDLDNIPQSPSPYEIRVKGLREELSKDELVIALLHIAKRRGIHNVEAVDETQDEGNELSTKEQLAKNNNLLKDKYVCELLLERLKDGKVRGEKNRFKTTDIIKEVKQLLETQKEAHQLDDDFINRYIDLIETRREYFEGPGKGSPFGWGGDLKKWYETLMGHCTYFPNELRSVKYSYSADLFNALNDLNNLVIQREGNSKLEYHEKYHIIENVFKQKKKPTLKQIANEIGVSPDDIKGFRINKSGKETFTEFKLYHDLKKVLIDQSILENVQLLDQIAEILTIYQDKESIINELNQLSEIINEQDKESISNLSGYNGTHRLSLKCINLVIEELWHTSRNQMEIFTYLNIKPKKIDLAKTNKIPKNMIDEFILSPVVKRTFGQAINVINKVIEKYGVPEDIIIELARESNSKDKQKFINSLQKKNETTRKRINEIIGQYGNQNAKRLVEKIRLHDEQEGKCLYSLESIPLEDLINNPQYYEVDAIIPRSVSFDNSYQNKVLVKQTENSKKSNRTPYQYFNSGETKLSYNQFKQHVLNLSKSKDRISKKKKEYLLEERDINKYEVQKEFINRNLVDTRYATRELTNYLKAYFSANDMDVKVKTINGSFTDYLRKVWKFKKERNHGYKHHAEDALIIANADFLFKENKKLKKANAILEQPSLDNGKSDATVENDNEYVETFSIPKQVNDIKEFRDFKFSHRVDKKPNRQLINDTLYSTRKIENHTFIVSPITNIYSKDNDELKKKFNKNPEKFLMYQHDPKTFEKLEVIMKQYANEKNPLAKYHEETGEYLTKYSKKNNGPIVKTIKVLGDKVGKHLDVTHKYKYSNSKIVKKTINPYRFDVYLTDKGYKFITISYLDVLKKDNYYYILKEKYEELKIKKSISDTDQFIGSFYYNDLIKINDQIFKVVGVNNDLLNRIELDLLDISYKEYCKINNIKTNRIIKGITKKITNIEKFSTDVLGNLYKAHSNHPQLIFKQRDKRPAATKKAGQAKKKK